MKKHDNATAAPREALLAPGLLWGLLGTGIFSLTLPATRLAVRELDPALVGLGRAVIAGGLAALVLAAQRRPWPDRSQLLRLAAVSLGVVLGFPLFSALAMARMQAADGAVIVGLLPAATAVMGALRAGERLGPGFWGVAALGLCSTLLFAAIQGAGAPQPAHGLALLAVLCAAVGYAEGALLSRALGSGPVICWALVLALPLLLPITLWRIWSTAPSAHLPAWLGFGYVAVFSMFLGFFPWYHGLALGGIARIGQVQLVQPVLTLLWSNLLLGEPFSAAGGACCALILACAFSAQRQRFSAQRAGTHGA